MKYGSSFLLEWMFWILALVMLAWADPHDHHFSLCPLANFGIEWCPGCGLGRSISALLHGEFVHSFRFHWLGIFALLMIIYRIGVLSVLLIKRNKRYNLKFKED